MIDAGQELGYRSEHMQAFGVATAELEVLIELSAALLDHVRPGPGQPFLAAPRSLANDRPRLHEAPSERVHVSKAWDDSSHASDVVHLRDISALAIELADQGWESLEALGHLYTPIDPCVGSVDVIPKICSDG